MNTVTFIVALLFSLAAAVVCGIALVRISRNSPRARDTLTAGFGIWLLGSVVSAILFGVFSL